MTDCLELIGNIVAIHPLPVGELSFSMPFNVRVNSLDASAISYAGKALSLDAVRNMRAIAIDSYLYYNVRADNVVIEQGTTVKESSKLTIAGIYYTTKISSNSYDGIAAIRKMVSDMSSVPAFDVLVVDSSDNVFLLRGVEPATSISMSATLPVTTLNTIEIEVQSVSGLIPISF